MKDIDRFTIHFNKVIANIDFRGIIFKCNGDIYRKDINYRVSQGTFSNMFTVIFLEAGDTYSMYVYVPAGAITLEGEYKNTEVNYTYSYRNGVLSA